MASELYTIHTCDRCSKKTTVGQVYRDSEKIWDWGRIWFGQLNGPIFNKKHTLPSQASDFSDLCDDCMKSLNNWYHKREDKQ